MAIIEIENLSKSYRINKRGKGMGSFVANLCAPRTESVHAVKDVNLKIEEGETVGFIGPNGAGKSSTIKMLTGILVPSSGKVRVLGIEPSRKRKENAWNIGVVFGQRTQLYWDLPAVDSFSLLKQIYKIPEAKYRRNMEIFNDLLELHEFARTPVRNMSLGQRMRADIAASLLHEPPVVYLDEPTIGLDLTAKQKMRNFIKTINEERKTTVIFSTHDMQDIEKTCKRIVVIDHGRIILDDRLESVRSNFDDDRLLVVEFKNEQEKIDIPGLKIVRAEKNKRWLKFDQKRYSVPEAIMEIAKRHEISDLTIKEPDIDAVIEKIYSRGSFSC